LDGGQELAYCLSSSELEKLFMTGNALVALIIAIFGW